MAAVVIMLLALCLIACAKNDTDDMPDAEDEDGIRVYCVDAAKTHLCWESYTPKSNIPARQLDELILCLEKEPENEKYRRLMPESVDITDYFFGSDGQLIVEFNRAYSDLNTIDELLCRAGTVRTLCQLEDVEYVEFYVEDSPLIRNDYPIGQMRDSDFIDNTGNNSELRQKVNLTVYFADKTGEMLEESLLVVENSGQMTMEQLVLEQLLNGPLDVQTEMTATIPEGTVVNKITTRDGVCYVDLNEAFLTTREGISGEVTVYCVVNSLVELPNVNKVKFTIDGQAVKTYGQMQFDDYFARRPELIVTEKAGE